MKRFIILFFFCVAGLGAFAQQTLHSSYFMKRMPHRHKLNPALMNDYGYISIPGLGNVSIGIQSDISLKDFLYPTADGRLMTFMHPDVSIAEFEKTIKNSNGLEMNLDYSILSFGFYAFKGYNTFDLSLRSSMGLYLPGDLFRFMKSGMDDENGSKYHLENLRVKSNNYVELALGHARKVTDRLQAGAKLKVLLGVGYADARMHSMDIELSDEQWLIRANGEAYMALEGTTLETKADGEITEAKKVTFKASMTVAATTATADEDTKSFSAVNPILTLTATSKQGQSRAAVVQKSDASNQYEADKDAVALLDSEIDAPMAYTVAGSYAAAVNAVHDYKNVPLGVYAKDGEEVELSIEGASQLVSPLYLYDAVTRSTTPIDGDSFTLNLTGSSHGRYFLTTDEGIKAAGDIRIYSPADGQLIIASTPSDRLKQVQVYDLNGRMVESRQNVGTATCQFYVPGGIYIVRVQSEQGEAQAKLKIK